MKKKILSLLAAFFMLFGTSAMAQVDSTLEGDVNGDGVVDIADITAVIAIIKQNAEANPTYYWYVGQTMPDAVDKSTWKSSTKDAGFTATVNIADGDNYLVIPDNWNYTAIEPSTNLPFEWSSFVKAADKTKIPGYIIRKAGNMTNTVVNVTFTK